VLPAGASPEGVLNLVGNAWEWTASEYRVTKRELFRHVTRVDRVLRGGAFNTPARSIRPTFRRHAEPDRVDKTHGFRCVYRQG
jgi:iron(II)-dependent oxidoreductase